jgi:hypothetical protein
VSAAFRGMRNGRLKTCLSVSHDGHSGTAHYCVLGFSSAQPLNEEVLVGIVPAP